MSGQCLLVLLNATSSTIQLALENDSCKHEVCSPTIQLAENDSSIRDVCCPTIQCALETDSSIREVCSSTVQHALENDSRIREVSSVFSYMQCKDKGERGYGFACETLDLEQGAI